MTDTSQTPQSVALVADPHAPDMFADEAVGFFIHRGVIRVTFSTGRACHASNPEVSRVVTGRLVMPAQAAGELAVELFDFLKRKGVEVPGLMRTDEPVQ